jgi:hypothetical protein
VTARRSARYDAAAARVRAVVNELDPIGLLGMEAPENEYDPEVTDLVRLVLRDVPPTEDEVSEVFRRWFGEDYGTGLGRLTAALVTVHAEFAKQR